MATVVNRCRRGHDRALYFFATWSAHDSLLFFPCHEQGAGLSWELSLSLCRDVWRTRTAHCGKGTLYLVTKQTDPPAKQWLVQVKRFSCNHWIRNGNSGDRFARVAIFCGKGETQARPQAANRGLAAGLAGVICHLIRWKDLSWSIPFLRWNCSIISLLNHQSSLAPRLKAPSRT